MCSSLEFTQSHEIDEVCLENYLFANLEGFQGPLKISQFSFGQSNPTFLLNTTNQVSREFRCKTSCNRLIHPPPRLMFCAKNLRESSFQPHIWLNGNIVSYLHLIKPISLFLNRYYSVSHQRSLAHHFMWVHEVELSKSIIYMCKFLREERRFLNKSNLVIGLPLGRGWNFNVETLFYLYAII